MDMCEEFPRHHGNLASLGTIAPDGTEPRRVELPGEIPSGRRSDLLNFAPSHAGRDNGTGNACATVSIKLPDPRHSTRRCPMRPKFIAGLFLLLGVLAPAAIATSGDRAIPAVQEAIVNFAEPTRIADAIVMGTVLIVHDDRIVHRRTLHDRLRIRARLGGARCSRRLRAKPGKGTRPRSSHLYGPRPDGRMRHVDRVPVCRGLRSSRRAIHRRIASRRAMPIHSG